MAGEQSIFKRTSVNRRQIGKVAGTVEAEIMLGQFRTSEATFLRVKMFTKLLKTN